MNKESVMPFENDLLGRLHLIDRTETDNEAIDHYFCSLKDDTVAAFEDELFAVLFGNNHRVAIKEGYEPVLTFVKNNVHYAPFIEEMIGLYPDSPVCLIRHVYHFNKEFYEGRSDNLLSKVGCAGLFKKKPLTEAEMILDKSERIIVFRNWENSEKQAGIIGAICRTAIALGCDGILYEDNINPYSRTLIRSSAAYVLSIPRGICNETITDLLKKKGFTTILIKDSENDKTLRIDDERLKQGKRALIIDGGIISGRYDERYAFDLEAYVPGRTSASSINKSDLAVALWELFSRDRRES